MKFAIALLGLAALVAGQATPKASITRTNRKGESYLPGDLIFSDEFNSLDMEKWQHEITLSGGGNWEFQVYSNNRRNSYVRNGVLHINPTLTNDAYGEGFVESGQLSLHGGSPADECTNPSFYGCERTGSAGNVINPIMSARLRTVESFYFTYGRVEVRAKLPAGDWLWPAIWMLPRHNQYGTWPCSGEIDIMESRGNRKMFNPQGTNIGVEQYSGTLHYGPAWNMNGFEKAHVEVNTAADNGFDRGFHTYGIEWTDQHIRFTLDNAVVQTIAPPQGGFWELGEFDNSAFNPWEGNQNSSRMAPFDQPFYLLINLATGGTNGFFPDDVTGVRKPWQNQGGNAFADFWGARNEWLPTWTGDDSHFQIDYVRIYAV